MTTLPVARRKRMSVHIPASMLEATDSWEAEGHRPSYEHTVTAYPLLLSGGDIDPVPVITSHDF